MRPFQDARFGPPRCAVLLIVWMTAVFWGSPCPVALIAEHKGPLHRLVAHLIGEVDAKVAGL